MNNTTQGTETTNLRQADAILRVEGVLSEKNLEVANVNGQEVIRGNLIIQTDDINFVTVGAYASKLTKAGKENSIFKGLATVMEGYKSIADVGAEEATKIRITNGQLAPETYFDDKGQRDILKYRSNFFNSLKVGEELTPKAEFEVEVFIQSIIEEIADGDTTGRLLVNGLMPTYNGIEPIQLVADGDVAAAISNIYDIGQTVRFFGDIINSVITKTVEIPVAIGKPQIKKTTTYKNELIITGASEAYEEGSPQGNPYDIEVIKKAMAEREVRLEEKKNKANNPTAATGGKAKPATNRALPF